MCNVPGARAGDPEPTRSRGIHLGVRTSGPDPAPVGTAASNCEHFVAALITPSPDLSPPGSGSDEQTAARTSARRRAVWAVQPFNVWRVLPQDGSSPRRPY